MSAIKFHKASEYKKVFNENGLARQSVLTGEYKDVAIYKCTLAAGAKWEPELYPQQEKVQILLFTEGTGYVATPHKAFQIKSVDDLCQVQDPQGISDRRGLRVCPPLRPGELLYSGR